MRSAPPKFHAILVAVLVLLMGAVWLAEPAGQQANAAAEAPPAVPPTGSAAPAEAPPLALVPVPTPPLPLIDRVDRPKRAIAPVMPGDNLSMIFARHDLRPKDLQLVLDSGTLGKRLKSIHPGHRFEFERDDDGNLVFLKYSLGPLDTVEFRRVGDRFEGRNVPITPDVVTAYAQATIESSLFLACQRAGLDDKFATRLAEIFQWDIDFILDVRTGDEFHVLYEELHVNGKRVKRGDILAAEFVNQGDSYQAVRYERGGTRSHYAPDGANMRKAFLRAPLAFDRVSSHFNLRRVHPLWKSSMPHRGIDYAAPTGTPVRAAGDGVVTIASRTKPNGNYIVLKHGERYQTKYLHLSKFARGMRKGRRVAQGDTIGYVGATGWATGPHLHYEFLDRGVHKNPRTVALPKAEAIDAGELPTFRAATEPLLAQLEDHKRPAEVLAQR